MGKYFGTDGFRGEANVDLTVEHAYKVGRFLGWYYGQKAKGERCRIVIGKDTRRSSYMFEYALVSGLTASGADAYLLHVTTTQRHVVEQGLDVGFAYDGDADRCLAVDENGEVVDGDRILYICGKYMKEQGNLRNNKIVTTVMSNLGLYKALDREGIGYDKTAVGDKYVYENMSQTGNCLGGEQSGHIIFSKYATTGDGILTSLKIMEVMLEKKETLSRLASEVTILPQVLKNVRVADKAAALGDEDVKQAAADVEKALGSDGRLLLRQSGTEPLIRVMVEAESTEICEKYVDQVIGALRKKGHAVS